MTRPGVVVQTQTAAQPRSAPTSTGIAFMAGLCDQGAQKPILCQSLTDFANKCGARVAYSVLYDCVDSFFREGGNSVYISRVVGPAAAVASHNFLDAGAAISLVAKALGPGLYGNNISVAIIAPLVAGYRVQVLYNAVVVETSPDLATQADAITWALNTSQYISFTLGVSANPPAQVAAAALAGGADDRGNIVDANWLNALNVFTPDLGPGQVLAPGRTTDVGHQQLCDHAKANNRVALLDLPDTNVKATLETSAANAKSTGNGQYGAAFAPWLTIPGVVPGSTRTVAPAAAMAGMIARVDASDNPNVPAAGNAGQFRYVTGLSQPAWVDADRQELNGTGVNVIVSKFNGFRNYGYRSLADPVNLPTWLDFSNVRYLMWLSARCLAIGEQFLFAVLDGQGHTIADYGAALAAICQGDWNAGIIFGNVASDAFSVDVSDNINTPVTIQANQLLAVVAVRPSPFAELVTITIVNVPITGSVS